MNGRQPVSKVAGHSIREHLQFLLRIAGRRGRAREDIRTESGMIARLPDAKTNT
jgi:hypothetical protein